MNVLDEEKSKKKSLRKEIAIGEAHKRSLKTSLSIRKEKRGESFLAKRVKACENVTKEGFPILSNDFDKSMLGPYFGSSKEQVEESGEAELVLSDTVKEALAHAIANVKVSA
jgi:hypothetical protein